VTSDAATEKRTEPHRLVRETTSSADHSWMVSRFGLVLVPAALTVAVLQETVLPPEPGAWRAVATSTAVTLVSWVRTRRLQARAHWYATTPQWWDRLDEAPTLLTFPRLVWAVRRVTERLVRSKRSKYGYE
jgi:hypothetical protein